VAKAKNKIDYETVRDGEKVLVKIGSGKSAIRFELTFGSAMGLGAELMRHAKGMNSKLFNILWEDGVHP
jgi:hypothetical protein